MQLILIVIAVLLLLVFVLWRTKKPLLPESLIVVSFDDTTISTADHRGESQAIRWEKLTRVGIRTTDAGPLAPDVFWGLHAGDTTPAVEFPGGATGEQELLKAMEVRLSGFRDDQVTRAMGSTANDYFVVWERPSIAGEA